MKTPLLTVLFISCLGNITFGQSQKEFLHGIGIDFYSYLILPATKSVNDIGFDLIYRGFLKKGFARMRFGTNKNRVFPKGHQLYRNQQGETCQGNRVFTSTYLQGRNYKFQFGYAFTKKLKKLIWYYGLDIGLEANRSWARPREEDCRNTPPALDESDTAFATRNQLFLYELMTVLGLNIPLNSNLDFSVEFGAPVRYTAGELNFLNEANRLQTQGMNSFEAKVPFLQDLALIYHF